jgi:hypothetical protein
MKSRVVKALLLGLVITALSLLYRTGDPTKEPMGGSGGAGICNGAAVVPPSNSLASRGFPLSIVSLTPDEDEPGNYYHAINATGLLVDYALASLLCFGLFWTWGRYKSRRVL